MILRLTILLLIFGCSGHFDNNGLPTDCMVEYGVETCVELDELYEIANNEYLSATEDISNKFEIFQNIQSCKESSCPETNY